MNEIFSNDWFRAEWRKLGFHYVLDENQQKWIISGSKEGLESFAENVKNYSLNKNNDWISCHVNLGPYDYLEIGTWDTPEINSHWIAGTLENLLHLSLKISYLLREAFPGDIIKIGKEFFGSSSYELHLCVMSDEFDPSSKDLNLSA
ncbi:hypothetical protein HF319_01920 [Xanthomonas sp. Kuri4-1]